MKLQKDNQNKKKCRGHSFFLLLFVFVVFGADVWIDFDKWRVLEKLINYYFCLQFVQVFPSH